MNTEMNRRVLPDGRILVLYAQIFNYKLTISSPESFEFGTLDDAYEYENASDAVKACETWDGKADPPGRWVRHLATMRRRPGGDPSKEYIAP